MEFEDRNSDEEFLKQAATNTAEQKRDIFKTQASPWTISSTKNIGVGTNEYYWTDLESNKRK